ncbi:MAG TPA: VWA domain-containing protein [Thermoplasmata archaeon]|jgi:Ca-activated chloride channel family protein|nr:VWA domain-containing protein [Thermoplasmata archaeon]
MKCTANRTALKPNTGTSVFVAVDLTPSAAAVAGRTRSIALALDSSGSMDGAKIEQAKSAALGLIKQLRPTDQLSIVSFADSVTVQLPASRVGNAKEVTSAVKGLTVGGLTAMYDGLEAAFKQARQASQEAGTVTRVILLTDGNPTVGRTDGKDFVAMAQAMREAGITITAIGIGNDYNEFLLQKVAEAGGGLWHHIDEKGGSLPEIFQEQAAQMAGTLVAHPELKVSIMQGAELADAYSVRPVLNRLPRPKFDGAAYTIPLRDLIAGEEQTIVFRLGVPSRPAGKGTLIRLSLVEVTQDVEVTFTDDARQWNVEANPYPRTLLSSAEATVLIQRAVQTKEASALQKAETIMKTLASDAGAANAIRSNQALNDVVTTMRDAQATVMRSGLQLSESAKKEFLQATTVIGKKKKR